MEQLNKKIQNELHEKLLDLRKELEELSNSELLYSRKFLLKEINLCIKLILEINAE